MTTRSEWRQTSEAGRRELRRIRWTVAAWVAAAFCAWRWGG